MDAYKSIVKRRYNAFFGTELEAALKCIRPDEALFVASLCGLAA
jgi:nicotinamidase-related amidase